MGDGGKTGVENTEGSGIREEAEGCSKSLKEGDGGWCTQGAVEAASVARRS